MPIKENSGDQKLAEVQDIYKEQLENWVVHWSSQAAFITLKTHG
jgi:hypothetical protein